MRLMSLALVSGLVFACGKIEKQETTTTRIDDGSNTMAEGLTSMYVSNQTQLPICTASNQGSLAYVSEQSLFVTCNNNSWSALNINSSGPSGAIYCTMTVTQADLTSAGLDNVPASGLNFYYSATQFKDATVYVQARVSTGSASYSSGIYWTAGQEGYSKLLSDNIALDVHGAADFGYWYALADDKVTGDANNALGFVYADPTRENGLVIGFDIKNDCTRPKFN